MIAWAETFVAEAMVNVTRGVLLPSAELRTIFPVPAVKLKELAPLTAPPKRISPAPNPELRPPEAKRVMGLEKEIF